VVFGIGIASYFAADREPAVWAVLPLAAAAVAIAFLSRQRTIGFPIAVALAGVLTGLAVATLQASRISHPILKVPIASAALSGFVEIREERERSDRIVIRVERFDAPSITSAPERVRVAVTQGYRSTSRQLCRSQGAPLATHAAIAARRVRFCARHVFPANRRFGLRPWCHQDQTAPNAIRLLAEIRDHHRRDTRVD